MKLTIMPTKTIAMYGDPERGGLVIPARVWVAEYDGVQVQVLVAGVGLDESAPAEVQEKFNAELIEIVGGPLAYVTNEDNKPPDGEVN